MRFLNKHAAREKELRRLDREENRLHQAKFDAPIVPLEHPRHQGWTKTYVLEAGVDRRPDATIFRAILAAVNRRVYSRDRSFVHPGSGRPIVLRPRILHARLLEQHGWPPSHRRLFELGSWPVDAPPSLALARATQLGYKLVHTWWLREEVQPWLIAHRRVNISDVDTRLAEIKSHMSHTQGRKTLLRLRGESCWWPHYDRTRRELRIADRFAKDGPQVDA